MMLEQFEEAKPLVKKIGMVCHQINTNIVFYALIDALANLIVSYIIPEEVEAMSEKAVTIFTAQIKHYKTIKATKKQIRRKKAGITFH